LCSLARRTMRARLWVPHDLVLLHGHATRPPDMPTLPRHLCIAPEAAASKTAGAHMPPAPGASCAAPAAERPPRRRQPDGQPAGQPRGGAAHARAAGGAAARLPHLQHGLQRLGRAPLAHGRHAQEQQDRAHRADRRAGAGAARRRRAPLARVHPALASRAWVVRPGARQARAKWSPALGVPCSVHIGAHKRR